MLNIHLFSQATFAKQTIKGKEKKIPYGICNRLDTKPHSNT